LSLSHSLAVSFCVFSYLLSFPTILFFFSFSFVIFYFEIPNYIPFSPSYIVHTTADIMSSPQDITTTTTNTLDNVIAWLVPTARGSYADKATHMPENAFRTVSTALPSPAADFLASRLPALQTSRPQRALQLRFDQAPKRPGGSFVLGTDPHGCDVVLPKLPGIAPRHCSIGFDEQGRLVLDDFSDRGTQVWYDWDSVGDKAGHSWVLSSGSQHGFPDAVRRITVDVQGVRFQIVVNDHSADWDTYHASVDAFCAPPAWSDGLTLGWDRGSLAPIVPLFSAAPLFQHIFVKDLGEKQVGEFYVWNLSRPWEPIVKATA
jgi:hypothetical protein